MIVHAIASMMMNANIEQEKFHGGRSIGRRRDGNTVVAAAQIASQAATRS
jgi:hypothetical protein